MSTSSIIIILVIVLLVMLGIWLLLLRTSRRVNLTRTPEGQKPEWMRSTPPPETVAATQADGEGITLYDLDKRENESAPFAEQIEDILRSQLSADSFLHSYDDIDLGTGPDGGLEIRVGDKRYASIEQIPELRLREAIKQAVATYNQRQV
jgi:hypothetical protein